MTSIWEQQDLEARIVEILSAVPTTSEPHHFGRPFVTAYQLAIGLHRRYPSIANALGVQLGGLGTGEQTSLMQYLAQQLSRRIRQSDGYPVEGAFLSNIELHELTYRGPDGSAITSSLTGSGFDLSLFRLRDA